MTIKLESLQHLTPVAQKSYLTDMSTALQTKIAALQALAVAGNKDAAGTANDLAIELGVHQYLLKQIR